MAPDPNPAKRRQSERRGHAAEYWAALYLFLKGYRILAMRYRTPMGEVDLIVRRRDVVAFVEVKARRTVQGAVDAVSLQAQRRIKAAADLWLSRRRDAHLVSLRFDIVAVRPRRLPVHFIDAF